jgi:hypothetical protein
MKEFMNLVFNCQLSIVNCQLSIVLMILLGGCKGARPLVREVPVRTETRVVERMVPVAVPQDSASLMALIECDSINHQLRITNYELQTTAGMKAHVNKKVSGFEFKVYTVRDTAWLPVKDSIVYQEKPVYIDVPVEVNVVKGWQWFLIWTGGIALACLVVGLVLKFWV